MGERGRGGSLVPLGLMALSRKVNGREFSKRRNLALHAEGSYFSMYNSAKTYCTNKYYPCVFVTCVDMFCRGNIFPRGSVGQNNLV